MKVGIRFESGVMIRVVFFLTICISLSSAASAMDLPIKQSDVEKEVGYKIDPLSEVGKEIMQQYTVSENFGRGQMEERSGNFAAALRYYDTALKLNKNYDRRNPRRGFLLAKMGRWNEAQEDFKHAFENRWQSDVAEKIVDFCIEQNHPEQAKPFEYILRAASEKSSARMALSRLCAATDRLAEAIQYATDAYYLDCATQQDPTASKTLAEKLSGKSIPYPAPNTSKEPEFWRVFDATVAGGIPLSPDDIRKKVLSSPVVVVASVGEGRKIVERGFESVNPNSPLRSVLITFATGQAFVPNGIVLKPSLLFCCLKKQEVIAHLSERGIQFDKAFEATNREDDQPKRILNAHFNGGKAVFSFANKGFGQLESVEITFVKLGPSMAKALQQPVEHPKTTPKTWQSLFEDSQKFRLAHKYLKSRNALIQSFLCWCGPIDTDMRTEARRKEYEHFKGAFIELYGEWKKPEIQRFFEKTSFWYLREEAMYVGEEPQQRVEFPTLATFMDNKWTVSNRLFEPYMDIKVADRYQKRTTQKGSDLYGLLHARFAKSDEESRTSEDTVISHVIDPLDGKYFDDEDFARLSR